MEKEKILYVSPLPPQKSGISDYSEILIYALKEYYDIDLLIEDYRLSNKSMYQDFGVFVYKKDSVNFSKYKAIIYNIGNNPQFHGYIYELCLKRPGLVIMHDFVLYYLIVGYYAGKGKLYSKLYEIGGVEAIAIVKHELKSERKNLLEYKNIAPVLPLNKELIKSGNKIMVHSDYARKRVESMTQKDVKIKKINMIAQTKKKVHIIARDRLFNKYNIPVDAILIGSFGYVAETKLNEFMCKAILNIQNKCSKKVCYVMVGEGNYVDEYVDNKTIFKTGYVDSDEMDSFLKYIDIGANLRYPSMGETSAAMLRLLENGKPTIIIKDGWFAEIPEDCVVPLGIEEIDRLESVILQLLSDEEYRGEIGKNAQEYIKNNHSEEAVCLEIKKFIEEEWG